MVLQRQLVLILPRVDLNWRCWRPLSERLLLELSGVELVIVSKGLGRDFSHPEKFSFWSFLGFRVVCLDQILKAKIVILASNLSGC